MTGKWFEIKCISVFTWFQPSNLRDNLLNYNTDTKSNFWLKTNTIFFLYEFDLSLFSLQYNHVISGFKNIITNFHEATQNAVQWYWICETSCKEITWFATKFCIRVWFCPGSRAKQTSYRWNPIIFPKFLSQNDLSWKFFYYYYGHRCWNIVFLCIL